VKTLIASSILLGVSAAVLLAQTGAFDVAVIRPAAPPTPETMRSGQFRPGSQIKGDTADFGFVTLADLLPYAFRVKSFQVSAPAWARESRWNIVAKLPQGASKDQVPEMVQALLTDRFKLSIHHEKREQPVYELIVGKGGSKLEAVASTDGAVSDTTILNLGSPGMFPGRGRGDGPANGDGAVSISPSENCGMRLESKKLTMAALADALTPFLDRPVVDKTELKGAYKLALDLPMEAMFAMMQNMGRGRGPGPGPGRGGDAGGRGGFGDGPGRGGPGGCIDPGALASGGADASSAALFQAVQKLGLKLQPHKAQVDTIVVDHLEKTPSEN
jgi:uncharacterized protein (TIGR03435 family)